jgi:hypothetical protein
MTGNPMIAMTAGALALFMAGQANALTLSNGEGAPLRVEITEGGDEAVTHDVVLAVGQTLDGLCEEGCTISLESGAQESFEGYEAVTIEDGDFLIGE